MENNQSDYEQKFVEQVKQTTSQADVTSSRRMAHPSNKFPIIILITLICIVIIETIALISLAVVYSNEINDGAPDVEYTDSAEAISEDGGYTFDDTYTIVAFDLVCVDDDGNTYSFAIIVKPPSHHIHQIGIIRSFSYCLPLYVIM